MKPEPSWISGFHGCGSKPYSMIDVPSLYFVLYHFIEASFTNSVSNFTFLFILGAKCFLLALILTKGLPTGHSQMVNNNSSQVYMYYVSFKQIAQSVIYCHCHQHASLKIPRWEIFYLYNISVKIASICAILWYISLDLFHTDFKTLFTESIRCPTGVGVTDFQSLYCL